MAVVIEWSVGQNIALNSYLLERDKILFMCNFHTEVHTELKTQTYLSTIEDFVRERIL